MTESSTCTPGVELAAFEAGDVDADASDHEAHVYVGWQYLRSHELDEALARFGAAA